MLGKELGRLDEDCLYLNVWTPANRPGPLPVMIWIHGGGHATGSGSRSLYNGRRLAERGAVVVTINYRLGPFGWLAHPALSKESPQGVSGNYGMLDQLAALRWVRDNIAAFGGDPKRVTIFGESAGAVSVARLMVCPQAAGLFHRAVAQSGGARGRNRHLREARGKMESAEQMGVTLADKLEAKTPADLRAISWRKLLDASSPAQGLFGKGMRFGPVVDGWLIPDDPDALWQAGRQHDVPFMAGFNADEGTVFMRQLPIRRPAGYRWLVRRAFGDDADAVLRLIPASNADEVRPAINKLVTVSAFAASARAMAAGMATKKSPGYLYRFSKVAPRAAELDLGAFHGLEIFYVFGATPDAMAFDASDRALSDTMADAWVRFAATGDPNGTGMPRWPAYDPADDKLMAFGPRVGVIANPLAEECDLFDRINAAGLEDVQP